MNTFRRNRVVMTTIGSLGDLHPYIALALEMKRRYIEPVIAKHAEGAPLIEALLDAGIMRLRPVMLVPVIYAIFVLDLKLVKWEKTEELSPDVTPVSV